MAAYDLRVQKPSSLAVPKGPGADDLARFLSVSESNRANTQKEQIQRDTLDWEKGAQDRALAAAEAERERKRQENMARGRTSTETVDQYLSNAEETFRLSEGTLKEFDRLFPHATPEQREGVLQKARSTITQTPGAHVDQKKMSYDLENTLVNDHGWDRELAKKEAARQVSAHFAAPGKMDDDVKEGYLDAIGDSGVTGNLTDYYSQSSGKGSTGFGDSGDYMDAAKFVKKYQRDDEANKFPPGSKNWWNFNYPWEGDKVYTDNLTYLSTTAQTDYGVKPQYVGAVIESLTENGRLPKDLSADDMKNPESGFFKDVVYNAAKLQQNAEGFNGRGGRRSLTPEEIRASKQSDLDTRFKALDDLNKVLTREGGKPLTEEEQIQLIIQPDFLKEFDLVMKQTADQNTVKSTDTETRTNPAADSTANPKTAEVDEEGSTKNPAADELDKDEDANLKSIIEGTDESTAEDQSDTDTPEKPSNSISLGETLQKERDAIEADISRVYSEGGTLELLPQLMEELNSVSDRQDDAYAENVKNIVESGITDAELKDKIPDASYRSRAKALITKIKDGSASKSQMLELNTIFTRFDGTNKVSQPVQPRNTTAPSNQKVRPEGSELSLEEMLYEPNESEIYPKANVSEQAYLNRSLLKDTFPDAFL